MGTEELTVADSWAVGYLRSLDLEVLGRDFALREASDWLWD